MDITMIGLQNAGKTSLLRVLAVSLQHLKFSYSGVSSDHTCARVGSLPSSKSKKDEAKMPRICLNEYAKEN